ncbi:MAG: hypothetical protein WBJ21_12215 [Burkholderiaceae bacterium]
MKVTKLLAISIRDESFEDFLNIAKRVNRLDSSIGILIRNGSFHPREIPLRYQNIPLLTLYLVNPPDTPHTRGCSLSVKDLGKLEEYKNFIAAGVPIPKVKPYTIGETVDAAEWGDYVVLKPVYSSHAIGNLLIPTNWLKQIERNTIPPTHPLASNLYLLQQFVNTGAHAMSYRVLSFLGQPLMCISWRRARPIKFPESLDEIFTNESFTSNFKQEENLFDEREFKIANDEEVVKFSSQVFNANPDLPLQGIDIVRDAVSGKLFVLENNSGGNVWTFSNQASPTLKAIGRKALVTQFMAFDRAAEILVKKTHELAR